MNAAFLPVAHKDNELILFGGESFENDMVVVYNDLFRYNVKKAEWKKIESPNSPAPRCSHQCVCAKNFMYTFGGEFTSPSQSQFYHYRDTWKLNLDTNQWTEIQTKGSPNARSGHRMQLWRRKVILFGGFYDVGTETRYFNDIWAFDVDTEKWTKLEPKNALSGNVPAPRSGCVTGVHGDYFYVLRGYSLEKKTKDSAPKGVVHTDAWVFNLVELTWEKIKTPGKSPSIRSGMSGVVDRTRILTFGGVFDEETKDDMKSLFYGDMFQFHMDSRRWFPLALNRKKKQKTSNEEADDDSNETKQTDANELDDDDEQQGTEKDNTGAGKQGDDEDEGDEDDGQDKKKKKRKGRKKENEGESDPSEEEGDKQKKKGKEKGKKTEKGGGKEKGKQKGKEEGGSNKEQGKEKQKEKEKEKEKGKGKKTIPEQENKAMMKMKATRMTDRTRKKEEKGKEKRERGRK